MAERLNQLFQTAPDHYLERTVLLTDGLGTPESLEMIRSKGAHHVDLHSLKQRSYARLLTGLHHYRDMPLTSYIVIPGTPTLIRFVFCPEFACCRLLIQTEGTDWLKLSVEGGLAGPVSPPEDAPDSVYLDSFAYWDYTQGHLVGNIRATAVLVKDAGQPWTVLMQQIVGTAGFEVVRSLFSRPLRY
jgi:hypothetical protein